MYVSMRFSKSSHSEGFSKLEDRRYRVGKESYICTLKKFVLIFAVSTFAELRCSTESSVECLVGREMGSVWIGDDTVDPGCEGEGDLVD